MQDATRFLGRYFQASFECELPFVLTWPTLAAGEEGPKGWQADRRSELVNGLVEQLCDAFPVAGAALRLACQHLDRMRLDNDIARSVAELAELWQNATVTTGSACPLSHSSMIEDITAVENPATPMIEVTTAVENPAIQFEETAVMSAELVVL